MKFDRSIWFNEDSNCVEVIDQRQLPFKTEVLQITSLAIAVNAIKDMAVRGAPLIGVTAAYGMYTGIMEGKSLDECYDSLLNTRPTAVNLKWALNRQRSVIESIPKAEWVKRLLAEAHNIANEDVEMCSRIGDHGIHLLNDIYKNTGKTVNILTHCNAGWLATVQWGTATSPIYKAFAKGIPLHVWVDETRPRNQGARLTAWELGQAGVDFHVITDNAGGHLMQHGEVDIVITGSDRTTRRGDVCNKIGTYLKALAAYDNGIPFYAALPSSTIDWEMADGHAEIPIEERSEKEVTTIDACIEGHVKPTAIMKPGTPARNFAFDVTPARLVTGIITERGICLASESSLATKFDR